MGPDDNVCLCFGVSLRKIRGFLERENPSRASLISECLGAGTGCHWCVPFLEQLHAQHQQGQQPTIERSPADYAGAREVYRETGVRPEQDDALG